MNVKTYDTMTNDRQLAAKLYYRAVAKTNKRLDGARVQIKDAKGGIVYFDETGPHPALVEIFNRHAAAMMEELAAKGADLEAGLKAEIDGDAQA